MMIEMRNIESIEKYTLFIIKNKKSTTKMH